jgi:hypothetical protein
LWSSLCLTWRMLNELLVQYPRTIKLPRLAPAAHKRVPPIKATGEQRDEAEICLFRGLSFDNQPRIERCKIAFAFRFPKMWFWRFFLPSP